MRNRKFLHPPRPSTLGPPSEECSVWRGDESGEAAKRLSFVISLEVHVLFPLIDRPPRRPSPHVCSPRNGTLSHLDVLGLVPV